VPFVSSRLGLPIVTPPAALAKSYDPEVSKQLKALLHQLPQLEEPFRFFKYTYYAYESWLDSLSNILSVESPPDDLFDRMECALSSYLFSAKAATDHLRSHYLLSGLGTDAINSRVALCRSVSKEFWVGEALRHYVTHTATPISRRTSNVNLSKRRVDTIFHMADAVKDAEKRNSRVWKDLLPLLPPEIDIPEYLQDHYFMTMHYIGAHFFSMDVLSSLRDLRRLLDLPSDPDKSGAVLILVEKTLPGDQAAPNHDLGLIVDCSGLLKKFEFHLSVFLLPKSALESP
jgi:hypothetical protein